MSNQFLSVLSRYTDFLRRNGWAGNQTPPPAPARGGYGGGFSDRGRGGGGYGGTFSAPRGGGGGSQWSEKPHSAPRETFGYGVWKDGVHVVGGRNMRIEKELFGDAEDPSKQHSGINFDKYDDIPVEATGAGVPEPVVAFTNPPLDPVLLENIGYARYTNPTPVQKYSIPIVANNRDLMACAQVRQSAFYTQDDI